MAVAFGLILGILTLALSGVSLEHYKRHRDRQSVAAILSAEMSSILHMVERRKTVELFKTALTVLESGQDFSIPLIYAEEPKHGPIFEKNIEKLGLLPIDTSEQVVQFYSYLNGVRAAIKNLVSGALEGIPSAAKVKASQIRTGIELWNDAKILAVPLIDKLKAIADEPWSFKRYLNNVWIQITRPIKSAT